MKALEGSGIPVASVATGFPSGLTSMELKLEETREAVAAGAEEIDMVIPRADIPSPDGEGSTSRRMAPIAAVKNGASSGASSRRVLSHQPFPTCQ